jgi:hypothetical protein
MCSIAPVVVGANRARSGVALDQPTGTKYRLDDKAAVRLGDVSNWLPIRTPHARES